MEKGFGRSWGVSSDSGWKAFPLLSTTHARILFKRVVFPEPKYPVRMVTGTVLRFGGIMKKG